jgi:AcrR family transcriptional regulator
MLIYHFGSKEGLLVAVVGGRWPGLLLDLLATGDRAATEEAFERFIELCEHELARPRGS